MEAELIVYDPDSDHSHSRLKIGDGNKNVNDLPFFGAGQETNENGEIFNDYKNNIAGIKGYRIASIESGKTTSGVYVRLRNNREEAIIYTLTIQSEDIKTLTNNTANLAILSTNSELLSYNTSAIANGEVTIKAKLAANGGYVQFNHKLTDLINGAGSVKVIIGEDENIVDYRDANFYVQLTSDQSGQNIVPKDDSVSAPNSDAISFRLFGYNGKYLMYTNKVASGAGAKYYTSRLDDSTHYSDVIYGVTLVFPVDVDGKVQIRNYRQDFINAGIAGVYISNQKLSDLSDPCSKIIVLNDATLDDKAYNNY